MEPEKKKNELPINSIILDVIMGTNAKPNLYSAAYWDGKDYQPIYLDSSAEKKNNKMFTFLQERVKQEDEVWARITGKLSLVLGIGSVIIVEHIQAR